MIDERGTLNQEEKRGWTGGKAGWDGSMESKLMITDDRFKSLSLFFHSCFRYSFSSIIIPEVSGLTLLKGALRLRSISVSLVRRRSFSDAEEREFGLEAKDFGSGESRTGVLPPIDPSSSM